MEQAGNILLCYELQPDKRSIANSVLAYSTTNIELARYLESSCSFPFYLPTSILMNMTRSEALIILIFETNRDHRLIVGWVVMRLMKSASFDLCFRDFRILWEVSVMTNSGVEDCTSLSCLSQNAFTVA